MTSTRSRILVACASFKGTLSSLQAGRAVARGLRKAGLQTEVLALADGGEGLVEALARVVPGARLVSTPCRGPLGERRTARFALLPPGPGRPVRTAVIEMAASSGLPLVPPAQRDPQRTTTWGVGDQIRAALNSGARRILLGLGGSATNEGGAGLAQALGVRLLDADGRELPPGGAALARLARVDVSGLDRRLYKTSVTVACDVNNPLCGPRGASAVYGPQKGAGPGVVKTLDRALAHYARVVRRDVLSTRGGRGTRRDAARVPGAGAAGGLGFGCLAFLGAELKPGIELVLDAVGFDVRLRGAALVITGEGRLDCQTLMGKAPAGVAERAGRAGVPCVAVGGGVASGARHRLAGRFDVVESLSAFAGSPEAAQRHGAHWLERLAAFRGRAWLKRAGRKPRCRAQGR